MLQQSRSLVHHTDINDIGCGFVENPVEGTLVIPAPRGNLQLTLDLLLLESVENPLSLLPDTMAASILICIDKRINFYISYTAVLGDTGFSMLDISDRLDLTCHSAQ